MEHRGDKQFKVLYEQYMPSLYRAALFILGNRKAAASVAESAFLQACKNAMADSRVFQMELVQALWSQCSVLSNRVAYAVHAVSELEGEIPTLAVQVAGLPFQERTCVVLYGEMKLSVTEIARLLHTPEWLIKLRLSKAVAKICRVTRLILPVMEGTSERTA